MTVTCTTYYRHTDLNTSNGALTHRYYVRDYLGSTRAVIDLYGNLEQTNDYNVTGIPSSRHLGNADVHKHTGKEFQGFNGLAWYDNNARYYDPILARFTTQDPLAEKYPWLSPYNHCANNPLKFIDPDGRDAQIIVKGNSITVNANIILTGSKATNDLAKIYKNDIMSKWGSITAVKYKGNRYSVNWNVNIRVIGKNEAKDFNGINNYMEVVGSGNSSVRNSNEGDIRSEGRNGRSLKDDCPMAHEFGHMLGISDKYGKIEGKNNYQKPISSKWVGDIMAEPTYNPVKITNGTINILFKGVLDNHLKPLNRFFRFILNNSQTIEYRNEQNREKKR